MAKVTARIRRSKQGIRAVLTGRDAPPTQLINGRAKAMLAEAIDVAPERTGTLRDSHFINRARPTGRGTITASVGNNADYALYVHQGTTGPIVPDGEALAWDGWGPWAGTRWFAPKGVAGQRAQPWLVAAYNRVARHDTRTTKFNELRGPTSKRGGGSPGGVYGRPI